MIQHAVLPHFGPKNVAPNNCERGKRGKRLGLAKSHPRFADRLQGQVNLVELAPQPWGAGVVRKREKSWMITVTYLGQVMSSD